MWTILWYPDGTENPWRSWYDQQDDAVRGKHDSTFRFLLNNPKAAWNEKHFKKLNGFNDLYEIRLGGKVKHRLFGTFGKDKQFIIVLAGIHKGKVYEPRDALRTSERRITEIKNGTCKPQSCPQP